MNKVILLIQSLVVVFLPSVALSNSERTDFPDADSVTAYRKYWEAFDDYDSQYRALQQGKYFGAWDELKREWVFQDNRQMTKQIDILDEAAKRYQSHLEKFPEAANTPFVQLNLAQIIAKIGQIQDEREPGFGAEKQKEALSILANLTHGYPKSAISDEAMYLQANILEALDERENAFSVWKKLADGSQATIYGVHANIAVGDYFFAKENASVATSAYKRARAILDRIQVSNQDYELVRLQYRIAWASYRAADLNSCLEVSQELLEPGREYRNNSIRKKIEKDATDLIADALFERRDMKLTKATLQRASMRPYSGASGFRIMVNLASIPSRDEVIDLGRFLVENNPQAKEMPDVLTLLADTYKREKKTEQELGTLERLALLLPMQSLWRSQHRNDLKAIKNMEDKALAANKILAASYYEQGLAQGTAADFKTAQAYYQVLLRYEPDGQDSEIWQLRIAHCLYFSGRWQEADLAYESFKNRGKIDPVNLEVAFYQQSLSREKLWRQAFQKSYGLQIDPRNDPVLVDLLRKLESNVDSFADRFPNRPYTVDLLLLVASANRDVNNYDQAEKYWNRSLLADPSPRQRALAIRGLVQSKVYKGEASGIVEASRNYLKLENWKDLGYAFYSEIRDVLATSVREYSDQLYKKGQIEEAGKLLLSTANQFPDIGEREVFYRDGAYNLAIAGSWGASLAAADSYLQKGLKEKKTDIMYLKARSLEYLFQFSEASKNYLKLVESYPNYPKALVSLQRAEQLALGEDDYAFAGKTALAQATYQKDAGKRSEAYIRAAKYFVNDKSWDDAFAAIGSLSSARIQLPAHVEARLLKAKIFVSKGELDAAREAFSSLLSEASRLPARIDPASVRPFLAEARFLLANDGQEQLKTITFKADRSNWERDLLTKNKKAEQVFQLYYDAIKTQDPEWSARSRYAAGQLAETMASSIREVLAYHDSAISSPERDRFLQQGERWQSLAAEYYNQNLLARHREPLLNKNNIWIERSNIKVAAKTKSNLEDEIDFPSSLGSSMPFQWSH